MTLTSSLLSGSRSATWSQTTATALFSLALAGILIAGLWAMLQLTPTGDIVWRLYVAEQVAQGKVIYQDVIETNPPLWFWAALPWHYLGQMLGVTPYQVLAVGVTGLAMAALWAFNSLTRDLISLG
jgi:hypothetical protein